MWFPITPYWGEENDLAKPKCCISVQLKCDQANQAQNKSLYDKIPTRTRTRKFNSRNSGFGDSRKLFTISELKNVFPKTGIKLNFGKWYRKRKIKKKNEYSQIPENEYQIYDQLCSTVHAYDRHAMNVNIILLPHILFQTILEKVYKMFTINRKKKLQISIIIAP